MPRSPILCLIACALALGGCAARLGPNVLQARYDAPYTLGSGDRVRMIVFGQDTLSNSYAVDGSGNIAVPLIGTVRVQNMTTREAEQAVEARFRNGFLREPRVSLEVEAFRPFFILGEVTTAGQYPYVNGMTVETAVAIAGGYTPRAYEWGADLTRIINGHPVRVAVPVSEPVRPGDTIAIRERLF